LSGFSGYSGQDGASGISGYSGYSGYSGQDGASGISGYSGYSGSGESGYSGFSGYSGYSGAMPSGGISGITSISTPEYIDFDINSPFATSAEGRLFYDGGDGTLQFGLKGGNVTLPIGQENVVLAFNNTASTLTIGQVVAVNGAQGQRPAVTLADADSEPLSAATLGVVTESIAAGAEGFVTTFGVIRGINTNGFTAGDDIYLSQTAGGFTATRPSAPAHTVFLGWVIKVNSSSGEIFVNINNGWELDELHNVLITNPVSNNSALLYDSTATVWKNQEPAVALNSLLPNQSGYSGYYLVSDGASGAYWGSGISGYSGFSGYSGYSGLDGVSGLSGYSGQNGASGFSGYSGSGISGFSGFSGYSGVQASIVSNLIYDTFTASASQTTFTTTNTYTSGKIEVFVNGVKYRNGSDVTVTSGTSVVMATGLTLNDLVDLVYPI
jgi:hypothetical protein